MTRLRRSTAQAAEYRASSTSSVNTHLFLRTLNNFTRSPKHSSSRSPVILTWTLSHLWFRPITVDLPRAPRFHRRSTQEGKRDEQDLRSITSSGTRPCQAQHGTTRFRNRYANHQPSGARRSADAQASQQRQGVFIRLTRAQNVQRCDAWVGSRGQDH